MSSFKSSENIQKKAGGPDRSVSDNQSSSVTLNELAMKARIKIKDNVNFTTADLWGPFLRNLHGTTSTPVIENTDKQIRRYKFPP